MVDAYPATQQASLATSDLELSPPTYLYLPPTEEHQDSICQHRKDIGAAVAKSILDVSGYSEQFGETGVRNWVRKGRIGIVAAEGGTSSKEGWALSQW